MSPKLFITGQPSKTGCQLIATNTKANKQICTRDTIFSQWFQPFGLEIHTFLTIALGITHLFGLYYFYVEIKHSLPPSIILFELLVGYIGGLGTTVGAHRYWTHKSFKAKLPLQILLMIMQTIALQLPIHWWCVYHRIHHKYTDTDADPHSASRGFWYSHIGWAFVPATREFKLKQQTIDMSDLENDPVVRFQSRWYVALAAIFHYIIPLSIVYYVCQIQLLYCFASVCRRHAISIQITGCINSVAHLRGYKPYDRKISATEGPLLSIFTGGEAWHNYHHTFPWDYKASEFGWKNNISTMFIDFFAYVGWAYDLKTVSEKVLKDRICRNGNSSLTLLDM